MRLPASKGEAANQVLHNVKAPARPSMSEHFVVAGGLPQVELADQIIMVVESQIGDDMRNSGGTSGGAIPGFA
jgi:hypothetical protein